MTKIQKILKDNILSYFLFYRFFNCIIIYCKYRSFDGTKILFFYRTIIIDRVCVDHCKKTELCYVHYLLLIPLITYYNFFTNSFCISIKKDLQEKKIIR